MMRWVSRIVVTAVGAAFLLGTAFWAARFNDQQRQVQQLQREKAELEAMLVRFQSDRRVAQLYIGEQTRDANGRVLHTLVQFKEYDRSGKPLPVRSFDVPTDVVYVDALIVRFGDDYVGKADKLRGHSLHLFRRIFGESQSPTSGAPLDPPNQVPEFYQTSDEPGQFEMQLWQRFWEYAADPESAAQFGVRVAQGEAVYQRVRTGQTWDLRTRANGGLEFTPERTLPIRTPDQNDAGTTHG